MGGREFLHAEGVPCYRLPPLLWLAGVLLSGLYSAALQGSVTSLDGWLPRSFDHFLEFGYVVRFPHPPFTG